MSVSRTSITEAAEPTDAHEKQDCVANSHALIVIPDSMYA